MKIRNFMSLSWFGLKTILFRKKDPILGTIILTDHCNLNCKHCSVNNINNIMYPYSDIVREMNKLYSAGIRILFFCGGETMLWKDGERDIRDLLHKAREIGFYIINVVTNGTISLAIPEADLVFLSIDGLKRSHNLIRGETFDLIMSNLQNAENTNICVYMAVNQYNYHEIRKVAELVENHPALTSISFNLHTPYEGTEYLSLTEEQKSGVIQEIKKMIIDGLPVFNLYSSLDAYLKKEWEAPCYQCMVSEGGRWYICGRCSEIEELCEECGYLFAVEFSMLCRGNLSSIKDMLKTYLKYV